MTALFPVLGSLAVVALALGAAVSVASEFAVTALERSQVDVHSAVASSNAGTGAVRERSRREARRAVLLAR